jgi:alpha-amylase
MKKRLLLAFFCISICFYSIAQTTVKKVVLQGYWWDYWNNNYPAGWANYLTELAPRLKSLGIDAVWIPPSIKNNGGIGSVGFAAFDNYDLGDKYQKETTKTRLGNKDELLRLIAVLHANGIEVIQDVVPNHLIGAGDNITDAGIDPDASDSQYKLFRYTSYASPASSGTVPGTISAYRQRTGRFPKNWQNFHKNPAHNCNSGDICQEFFGPDICYVDGANGQTNVTPAYDPNQLSYNPYGTAGITGASGNGYMRRHTREWLQWYKRQTGFDGLRLDAAKNYDFAASEDFLYNLQFGNSTWANGGNTMFAVGEVVDGTSGLDNWANAVQNRAGTFDFNLRSAIKNMVDNNGSYNMANLPGSQQNNRISYYADDNVYVNRTVAFVNNHDTFRPTLSSNGDYSGTWQTDNELGGGHIDPVNNDRLALAYATIMALDGNIQVFFEDLFNVGNTGQRFSHEPTNTTQLPSRNPLENLIWCHQNLNFKNGAYKVRSAENSVYFENGSSASDLLAIERGGKAVIGLNDRGDVWQSAYVDTDFAAGTVLKDYSGANGSTTYTVPNDKRVRVNTPPVNPANGWYGYSVWAPVNAASQSAYVPQRSAQTIQEWDMADDLGDSHCSSLGQGGQLPANSTHQRVVGKIFAASGSPLNYLLTPTVDGNNVTMSLWDNQGNQLDEVSGQPTAAAPLSKSFTPAADGWIVIKIRNTDNAQSAQRCLVRVSYTAPQMINTKLANNTSNNKVSIWTGNKNSTDPLDCGNWEEGLIPTSTSDVYIPTYATPYPTFGADQTLKNVMVEDGATIIVSSGATLTVTGNWTGKGEATINGKVSFAGTTAQTIEGINNFDQLTINNATGVSMVQNNSIQNQLQLTSGLLKIQGNLLIKPAASIVSASENSYIQTEDNASSTSALVQNVGGTPVVFPVGNSQYAPVTLTNAGGTNINFSVRNFEKVLTNGTTGAAIASNERLNKSWVITPETTAGLDATVNLQWTSNNQEAGFNPFSCAIQKNSGTTWQALTTNMAASGTDPYQMSVSGLTSFSTFSVFSNSTTLPVQLISFAGKYAQDAVNLKWDVALEEQMSGYRVLASADGKNFKEVGTVKAAQKSSYNFTHPLKQQNENYYQLELLNNDGSSTFSEVIYVKTPQFDELLVFPNPFNDKVEIKGDASLNMEMKVYSSDGKFLGEETGKLEAINQKLNKLLVKAPRGMYIVELSSLAGKKTLKLLKN